ncbi:Hypothetical predicted protein [Mytilus galloprovincialis]|uniref:Uncharacterized protein n=1 Tax=Mytilus galloprovincialis TaxID=29158 RepID=A0A8B6DIV2_MYTGA|nr:Hypothetical predicted protein [Mytilus galloprovincialis]
MPIKKQVGKYKPSVYCQFEHVVCGIPLYDYCIVHIVCMLVKQFYYHNEHIIMIIQNLKL